MRPDTRRFGRADALTGCSATTTLSCVNRCPHCAGPMAPGALECPSCGRVLANESLADRLRRGPLVPEQAIQIGLQVCCQLEAMAHDGQAAGAVDPAHVWLSSGEHGVSAHLESTDGNHHRADQVSGLGRTLYEMLSGQAPPSSRNWIVPAMALGDQLQQTEAVIRRMIDGGEGLSSDSLHPTHIRQSLQAALAADLGDETEARVRATLFVGSGLLASTDVSTSAPNIRQVPMVWGQAPERERKRRAEFPRPQPPRSRNEPRRRYGGPVAWGSVIGLVGAGLIVAMSSSFRSIKRKPRQEPQPNPSAAVVVEPPSEPAPVDDPMREPTIEIISPPAQVKIDADVEADDSAKKTMVQSERSNDRQKRVMKRSVTRRRPPSPPQTPPTVTEPSPPTPVSPSREPDLRDPFR